MSTDNSKPGSTTPPPGGSGEQRTENTGLHDIKAMARTTKQRISRRVSTQSDVEESLLASASSQSLSAIVLPEPGKDEPSYETDDEVVATPTAARAAATARAARTESRGGLPFWVYGAVGAVAIAAVVFFVMRGGSKKTEVAQNDSPGPVVTPMATGGGDRGAPPAPQPGATPIEPAPAIANPMEDPAADPAEDPAPADVGDSDQVVASAAPGESEASADPTPAPDRDDDGATRSRAASRGTAPKSSPRPAAPASSSSSSGSTSAASKADKADPKPKEPAKPKPKPDDGKRSLDDLLDEASGGAVANKDLEGTDSAAKPETKEPAKTDLSRAEIQGGMKKILGRVSACYDKYKEPGTVMISVVIETSGEVSGADATGKFKNTETGLCVSEAVRRASFASWEGKPKRFNYPFLLSD